MLICFGLGYSAEHFARRFGAHFDRIVGTVRSAERAAALERDARAAASARSRSTAPRRRRTCAAPSREADGALISIPQTRTAIRSCPPAAMLWRRRNVCDRSSILSTIGVYGDRGGGWVDEDTPAQPDSARSRERLAAEHAWQDFGARSRHRRSQSCGSPASTARDEMRWCRSRAVKPGASSNRARFSTASMSATSRRPSTPLRAKRSGIFNVADDEPCPPGDPIAFAAQLLGARAAAGNSVRASGAIDVADGAEFLAGMPAREERQDQTRARRRRFAIRLYSREDFGASVRPER